MARTKMQLTQYMTVCSGYLMEKGTLIAFPEYTMKGRKDKEQATKLLRQVWDDYTVIVESVKQMKVVYTMTNQEFMAYATSIETVEIDSESKE